MKYKRNIKKNIYEVKNNIKKQIIVCVILSSLVLLLFFIIYSMDEFKRKHNYEIIEDIKLIRQIESVNIKNKEIAVSGYAFMLGRDSKDTKISILFRETDDGNEIWAETKLKERKDVNAYYDYKYDYSGFIANAKTSKFTTGKCYEIIIKLDYNNNINTSGKKNSKTVSTQRYIYDYKLYSYNPNDFDISESEIKSDLIKKVFTNGQLCFYNKEVGLYVYQYKDNLYWIANEIFDFNKNGLTTIPYNIYTSKVNMLPPTRIKYNFDNLTFRFEEYEYTKENTEPFRVAIREIPKTYPVDYITTGVYDSENKEWIWKKMFQLENIFY